MKEEAIRFMDGTTGTRLIPESADDVAEIHVLGRLHRATQEKSGGTSRQHRCKRRMAESTYPSPIFLPQSSATISASVISAPVGEILDTPCAPDERFFPFLHESACVEVDKLCYSIAIGTGGL